MKKAERSEKEGLKDSCRRQDAEDEPRVEEGLEPSSFVFAFAWVARISAYSCEVAVLVWFGWYVDKTYSCYPYGIIVGATIGIVSFIAGLFATSHQLQDGETRDRLKTFKKD